MRNNFVSWYCYLMRCGSFKPLTRWWHSCFLLWHQKDLNAYQTKKFLCSRIWEFTPANIKGYFRFISCSISSLAHFRVFQIMMFLIFTVKRQQKNSFLFTTVKCLSVKSEINSGSIFAVNWCSFNEFIFNAFSILSRPCSCGFSSTKLTFQQSSKQTFQWNFV